MSSSRVFVDNRSIWDYPTWAIAFENQSVVLLANEIHANGILKQGSRFKCVPLSIGYGLLQVVAAVMTLAEMLLRGLGSLLSGIAHMDSGDIFTGVKLVVGGAVQAPMVALYGIFAATIGTVCIFISPRQFHGLYYARPDSDFSRSQIR